MDVIKDMKNFIILTCICFFSFSNNYCKDKSWNIKSSIPVNNSEQTIEISRKQNPSYEIISTNCSKDKKCVVIVFCPPDSFVKGEMEKIALKFSSEFKDKKVVNINLFDNKDIAESYAKGTRNLGDLQNERRGWYLRTNDKEFLLFFPNSQERNKVESIKLKP